MVKSNEYHKDLDAKDDTEKLSLLRDGQSSTTYDMPSKICEENVTCISKNKKNIIKNFIILNIGIFLYFSGYQNIANLQSTMNAYKGLGMYSQSVIYGTTMISAILLPKAMLSYFGCKITLVLSIVFSIPYILANFYPCWATLIPAAISLGIGGGPLYSSTCIYINEMAVQFHTLVPESLEVLLSTFSGISSVFMESTQIWSNLISFYVLKSSNMTQNHTVHRNCGASFIFSDLNTSNSNLHPLDDNKRYTLITINSAICILSVILLGIYLDPLQHRSNEHNTNESENSILATLKQFSKLNQLLLIPMTIFLGMELGFFTGDFTNAYIACYWSIYYVGFVVMCFGIFGTISAIMIGILVKYFSQPPVLVAVAIMHGTIFFALLKLNFKDDIIWLYIISGAWGFCDAIWWSQATAIYGIYFGHCKEAAFSNYAFWNSAGFLISYSYSNHLTIPLKVYILSSVLIFSMFTYFILKIRTRNQSDQSYTRF